MKPHTISSLRNRLFAVTGLAATLLLTGCGGDSDSNSLTPVTGLTNAGVVASVSSDFSSGGINVIDLDSANYDALGPYHESGSDIAVIGGTGHFYILGKYQMDNISKVDLSNLAKKTWDDFSVLRPGEKDSGNPYDLIRVNDQKAYLILHNSDKVLIVNPSATSEADFLTEDFLDLSAYTPSTNSPNDAPQISAGTIVGDRLFLTLQRLDADSKPTNTGYVAVFNTDNDQEIDTGKGSGGLKGIPLLGKNPADIQYHAGTGLVVRNIGTNYPTYGKGTSLDIISLNNSNLYDISSMFPPTTTPDDGQVKDVVIVNNSLGYIINLKGYGNTAVQSFNPATGRSSLTTINGLTGGDFRDIEISPKGNLWIADADTRNPGIRIVSPTSGSQITFVDSPRGLLPNNIAFVTE
jgi:hypothetical protein